MNTTNGSIENLSPKKRALYELLLKRRREQKEEGERIFSRPRDVNSFPLSFAQQRLWFLDQLEPGSAYYNLASAAHLQGPLDVRVLEQALSRIISRHEALRTTFTNIDGQPRQIIGPAQPFSIAIIDLDGSSAAERDEEIRSLSTQEARRPFDLSRGPLLRATLFRTSAIDHVLLLVMHHIVSDGWSMGILIDEVVKLYGAYSRDVQPALPDLPVQYADFAVWQRERLEGEVLDRQINYWKNQLSGAPSVLELAGCKPRPAAMSLAGAHETFTIESGLADRLRALSREEGATLFMTLLTAFQALLSYHSGSEDVVVGTDVANRNRGEIEGLIGFFVNQVVIRSDFSGDPRFREALRRVRETSLEAYVNQDAPFEKVVEAVNPQRSMSHTPLFQIKFLLQNPGSRMEASESQGLSLSRIQLDTESSRFDIVVSAMEVNDEIVGLLEYSTDVYDAAAIRRLLRHYRTLLEGAVEDPEKRLSELPFLTQSERRQLLFEWNETGAVVGQELCVHELFEKQAALTPNEIAVICRDERATYDELNRRANRLAHYLRRTGVRPGVLVGIYLERSLEMVVGILGTLKAGGAYLPLDVSYPASRRELMIEDAQPSVLLTQELLSDSSPQGGAMAVYVDADSEAIARMDESNPASGVTPDHLVYIVYTSGSTGRPRGVLVNHRGLSNRIHPLINVFGVGPDHRLLHCLSFSFDAAGELLYTVLGSGGSLIISPPLDQASPEELLAEGERLGATGLQLPASYWGQTVEMLSSRNQPAPPWIKTFMTGGERIPMEKLALWARLHRGPQSRFFNSYGPTEAVVTSTSYEQQLAAITTGPSNWLPIGRPLPATQIYLLDSHLRPAPIGGPGEIYIGGESLAWGYLNQPEHTAQKFIPDPFSANSGGRLYKTGDIARYLPDGNLDFIGRVDDQVKIRGYRIELGEIETALSQFPGVERVIVIPRGDVGGAQQLVAYIVPRKGESPGDDEMRHFLKQRLPEYMTPSMFVALETTPLLPNGKIDSGALPAPGERNSESIKQYVAPRNPLEEALAAVFSQVLGVENVGVHETFFALGGDSIRSIQVVARAEQRGLKISLQDLFQHQTISELAEMLSQKGPSAQKRRLGRPFDLIPEADRRKLPEGVEDAYPLTMAQSGMIYHQEYRSDVYHSIASLHLRAPVEMAALRGALSELFEQHPILRTSFDLSSYSEPLQLVHRKVVVPFKVEDLRHLTMEEQEQWISRWIDAEKTASYDWGRAPLAQFSAHLRSDETFQFTLSAPHAILDGWSDALLFTELLKRYLALVKQEDLTLEPPPIAAYRDYVGLEREALRSEDHRRYWREKLGGAVAMRLPDRLGDLGRGEGEASSTLTYETPAEATEGLHRLSRTAAVPIKSVLLAAHLKVMSMIHAEQDVLTGMVLNGRPEEEGGERLLGLFLNTLPFRFTMTGSTWTELIRSVFEAERELLPFRRYPLAQIQKDLGGQTLFTTYFDFTHFHVYGSIRGIKEVETLGSAGNSTTNFTLAAFFSMDPATSGVKLSLSVDLSKIGKEQADAFLGYYAQILTTIAKEPEGRHDSMPLLSSQELQRIEEWNRTFADYPREKCLHEWFVEQANRTPHSTAVIFEDQRLSYRDLDRRSNQLARYLRRKGVGAETVVGLCLERSLETPIALLGVLKAGGAYVPLDPGYPSERLQWMIEDAGIKLVLTQEQVRAKTAALESWAGGETLSVDAEWEAIAGEEEASITGGASAGNLAYVIYTSGSTGRPKGVMISHGSLVNHMAWMERAFPLGSEDRVLQKTPFSFDASVWEFYAPLLSGAQLVMARPGGHQESRYLVRTIIERKVSVLQTVPTLLRMLLDEPEIERCTSLRRVFCGGEALGGDLVERFERKLSSELHNLYGPTEATIDATSWDCGEYRQTGRVLIGKPVSNLQAYVLDEWLQPAPVGVAGELYLGGEGLSRGYLNRADLTAEKFMPNPYSEAGGERIYRTGDWVRRTRGGEIEYLGRRDQQVKIRGLRVELGEVESILSEHEGVQASAAKVIGEGGEDQRLVAYVVKRGERSPSSAELREHLKGRLPEALLPSSIITLEKLPLTPSGKVDRNALPDPEVKGSKRESVAPRTPIEDVVRGVWEEVLKLEEIGIADNFFDLGGHSLQVIRVVSRVREIFQVDLHLRSLFEDPTIEGLARLIETEIAAGQRLDHHPITPVPRGDESPLSFAQQRLWFLDQLDPGSSAYNVPTAIRLTGKLDTAALERTVNEIMRRHEVLRTSFRSIEGRPVQVIAPHKAITLPLLDLRELPELKRGEKARRLADEEARRPFVLSECPLFRIMLLWMGEEEHIALYTLHHIVCDGWSTGILLREVAQIYEAFSQGQPSPLAEPQIQYADFSHWQRRQLQEAEGEAHLAYWKRQLGGSLPVLKLSSGRPRSDAPAHSGARQSFRLDAELTRELKALSRRTGSTLFMAMLAGFKTLLYRYTGQEDLIVGTANANRNRRELEGLIGFFVNMLALRVKLSGDLPFVELLDRVRAVTLAAYSHQDTPFEKVVEAVQIERTLEHSPIIQVAFGLQNAPIQPLTLSSLSLSPISQEPETVKYDLTLWASEVGNELSLTYTYSARFFDAGAIRRMHSRYAALLRAIVADPEEALDALEMRADAERENEEQGEKTFEERRQHTLLRMKPQAVKISKHP